MEFLNMSIWLLVNHRSKQNKIDAFLAAANKLSCNLQVVFSEECQVIIDSIKSKVLYKGKEVLTPDAIISLVQLYTMPLSSHEIELLYFLESQGAFVLNTIESRLSSNNKLTTYRLLAQKNIPVPKTITLFPEIDKKKVITELNLPFIIKPIDSLKGQGVMLLESEQQFNQFMDFSSLFVEQRQTLLAQQFISESKGRDVRVIILGGKVIGAMVRTGAPGSIISNYAAGAQVEKYELDERAKILSIQAVEAIGLTYAGVDLLFNGKDFIVCEVNANPGFEGFKQATGIDVPEEIMTYLLSLPLPSKNTTE